MPKKKRESEEVGEFRPISVLNAYVKIISKVLANRLKNILGVLIGDHESGFLRDRSPIDSICDCSRNYLILQKK